MRAIVLGLGLVSMLVGSSASANNMIKPVGAVRAVKQQLGASAVKRLIPSCCSTQGVSGFAATTSKGHASSGGVTMTKPFKGEPRGTFNGGHSSLANSDYADLYQKLDLLWSLASRE